MSYIERCRERCHDVEGDEGFTLIELLVVLLIIGILLAIAIPTFLSVTKGANGTAAQSNLQTALTGSDTYYTNNSQSYNGILTGGGSASTLTQVDTGLVYQSATTGSVNSAHQVDVLVAGSGQVLMLETFAPGQNDCWGILDIKSTQATSILGQQGTGTYYFVTHNATSAAGCTSSTSQSVPAAQISTSKFPPA